MKVFMQVLGAIILLASFTLLINPDLLFGWVKANSGELSLYFAAIAIRLGFGIILWIAAKESKHPFPIKLLASLGILAGIIFIIIGPTRFQAFLDTLLPEIEPFAPMSGLFGIAIGGFFIYAFSSKVKTQIY